MKKATKPQYLRIFPPHFDAPLRSEVAEKLVSDPERVASHAFLPFIQFEKRWTRFALKGESGQEKCRLIRYAARRDAEIFAHYRAILSDLYEERLKESCIEQCVIGYRKIQSPDGRGKCNIDFAKDAFHYIRQQQNCYVYTLDISKFFEHIDHQLLKDRWSSLLGVAELPLDHYKVYRAVTRFACVDRPSLYRSLGILGKDAPDSKEHYLVAKKEIPSKLCDASSFREKVVPLIKVNKDGFGIPQGAPLSDLLSNLYLIEFDKDLCAWCNALGGRYFRYSDDILIVLPHHDEWDEVLSHVQSQIFLAGEQLEVQEKKCAAYRFTQLDDRQTCTLIHSQGCKNGVEYLGFRYNGECVFLRESTLAKLQRAIGKYARRVARSHVHHHPTATLLELRASVNRNRVYVKVGRALAFAEKRATYRQWTFWTYARRAESILSQKEKAIYKQLSGYRSVINRKIDDELEVAFKLRKS